MIRIFLDSDHPNNYKIKVIYIMTSEYDALWQVKYGKILEPLNKY